ncbi:MAG: hypothetical protein NTW05_29325 [Pseudonocardiales bacterium]|nr:hypothetical protein [Pseudonocardiales bacterium]
MVRRLLVSSALVWLPFLSLFVFASFGNTSLLHIAHHTLALGLLVPAVVLVLRCRRAASTRTTRILAGVLAVLLPLGTLGHGVELAIAVVRYAADGFADLDTSDLFAHGPHAAVATVTAPAMLASMLVVAAWTVTAAVQGRRRPARVEGGGAPVPARPERS